MPAAPLPRRLTLAAVLGGLALVVTPSVAQGVGTGTTKVPCDVAALETAIDNANTAGQGKLQLASNCTYSVATPATAGTALPKITGDLRILGGRNTAIERDAGAPTGFRILEVDAAGRLFLKDVALRNGDTAGLGGGILNSGTLELKRVVLEQNTASSGGGIANMPGGGATLEAVALLTNSTTGVGGGGMINFGTATLIRSVIDGNTAPINGGAINTQSSGVTTLDRGRVTGNTSGSLGGGLSNLGTTNVSGTTITGNTGSGGGGIATANTNVFLTKAKVTGNTPNNCDPLNTIPGCTN